MCHKYLFIEVCGGKLSVHSVENKCQNVQHLCLSSLHCDVFEERDVVAWINELYNNYNI